MQLSKTKITSRKFYNKWLYKVSLKMPGMAVLRNKTLEDAELYCSTITPETKERSYSLAAKVYANREYLLKIIRFLKHYDQSIWSKRIETDIVDIYTNDRSFYDAISLKFNSMLVHQFEPASGDVATLTDSHTIIGKKLPHDKYQFRVYLLPHKMASDKASKQHYLNWIKKQGEKITCTPAVEKWFLTTNWNWDRRYVLVEDEATLLMLKLRNAEVVGRIYKYVVSDK